MILVDYSGLIHANINAFLKDLEKGNAVENEDLIRHITLTSLVSIRKKYKQYGQLVIACDGRNYWRKDKFPHYKACRKKIREESKIDWDAVFKVINQLSEDLKQHFPYKVLHVDRAEADDVIAVMTQYTQNNEFTSSGLYPEPQQVLAISEDTDFMQLQKYDNFKLYHPRKKKMATQLSASALLDFTREHIAKGDTGDGVMNVLSPDDVFVTEPKGRQATMSSKRLKEFQALGREACKTDLEKSRWDRNQMLVDFDYIPKDVSNAIIDTYKNCTTKLDRNGIFNYLVQRRCRQLLDSISDF